MESNYGKLPPLKVFISSTYKDLKEHRKAVILDAIVRLGQIPFGMEYFDASAKSEEPLNFCFRQIEQADICVFIIGAQYGSVYDNPLNDEGMTEYSGKSFTQCEYDYAMSKEKVILRFIMSEDHPLPMTGRDTEHHDEITAFKKELKLKRSAYFDSKGDLVLKVYAALRDTLVDLRSENDSPERSTDSGRIAKEVQNIGQQPKIFLIGKDVNGRVYYVAYTLGLNFEQFRRYAGKTEIGSDWDNTPEWKDAMDNLKKRINEPNKELPDYAGNGARHNRGAHFVFSVKEEITESEIDFFYYR
jgi:hypothetical protein